VKPILLRDSPIAFRRRLILTEAEPLGGRGFRPRLATIRELSGFALPCGVYLGRRSFSR